MSSYRFALLLACMSVCTPALADQFNTTQGGGPSSGAVIQRRQGTSGTAAVPIDETNPLAVASGPGLRTIVALSVSTVTTGGTAVTALTAGQRSAGGWLQNPPSATINLCINEQGTASGTTSSGATTCITPGQTYLLTPASGAVSVVSSDSAHAFSGIGLQ